MATSATIVPLIIRLLLSYSTIASSAFRATRVPLASRRAVEQQRSSTLHPGRGAHYADLWVGSPVPQRQTVIVDTGSDVTAFPCAGYYEENDDRDANNDDEIAAHHKVDPPFDPTASSTFARAPCDDCAMGYCPSHYHRSSRDRRHSHHDHRTEDDDDDEDDDDEPRCDVRASYAEGSAWTAVEVEDVVRLGDDNSDNATTTTTATTARFGCWITSSGAFRAQTASGILGLHDDGSARNRRKSRSSVLASLTDGDDHDDHRRRRFRLCLSDDSDGDGDAGFLTLGGDDNDDDEDDDEDDDVHHTYAAMDPSVFYTVELVAAHLVDRRDHRRRLATIPIGGAAVVDSGATHTYLGAKRAFETAWKTAVGFDYGPVLGEVDVDDDVSDLPAVVLQLRGIDDDDGGKERRHRKTTLAASLDPRRPHDVFVVAPPERYVWLAPETRSWRTRIGLFDDDDGGPSTIGAVTMIGHDVLFDPEGGRMGWVESSCGETNNDGDSSENKTDDEGDRAAERSRAPVIAIVVGATLIVSAAAATAALLRRTIRRPGGAYEDLPPPSLGSTGSSSSTTTEDFALT